MRGRKTAPSNATEQMDLLYGASAIAKFLDFPVRRVFYMAETKMLPCFKLGDGWAARKSTLKKFIEDLERDSLNESPDRG